MLTDPPCSFNLRDQNFYKQNENTHFFTQKTRMPWAKTQLNSQVLAGGGTQYIDRSSGLVQSAGSIFFYFKKREMKKGDPNIHEN